MPGREPGPGEVVYPLGMELGFHLSGLELAVPVYQELLDGGHFLV